MHISRLQVSNFRSFTNLDVSLKAFNLLVGANASGKSNFAEIFRFLRDIQSSGLPNAISVQGGSEYLGNIYSQEEHVSIGFTTVTGFVCAIGKKKNSSVLVISKKADYRFSLSVGDHDFSVFEDELKLNCEFRQLRKTEEGVEAGELIGQGRIQISNSQGRIKTEMDKPRGVTLEEKDLMRFLAPKGEVPEKTLIMELLHFWSDGNPSNPELGNIRIYDFDPKLPKQGVPVSGKLDLEEDGSNLAIALRNIMKDDRKKRQFINLITDLLPFIEGAKVDQFADKSLLLKLKESYSADGGRYLPASLISDGTINITALIIALYFEQGPLCVVEEPERNIHPHLLSRVMQMMKEAAEHKQIICTTHNPEFIKHADEEDVLLVSRDENGNSSLTRPVEKAAVKAFLRQDMGFEELYIDNLLEV